MHLPYSTRTSSAPVRLLQTLVNAARGLVLGFVGLLVLAFTLLAGMVTAGVLLVVALVARRRLQRSAMRFAWHSRMGARPGAATKPSGHGHVSTGAGEIVDAEVREIRD
ncbi:hypothetical protein [uncultured Azohydromonas sp.]|jgi:hypothetical protein|uniref:hypothetical protein n=1 Tax=uncultured Azohydromonas sp. TaxID=487342 RepID=UPI002613909D|nr:hypothetical protein [uncultured Azohydromonas sp.]